MARATLESPKAKEELQREPQKRQSAEQAKGLDREYAIMAEIGRILSSSLDLDEVYERFAEQVNKLIPFDRIVIDLIDVQKNTIVNVYVAGKKIGGREVGVIYPLEGSGNAEMVHTRSTLLIQTEDFREYQARFPMLLSTFQAGFRSIMNIPLFSKEQIIGALLLRSLKSYAYTDEHVRLAEGVGAQIAGTIANAKLFTEHKRTEEALRVSEERFRRMFEQSHEAIFLHQSGRIIDANPNACKLLGYGKEAFLTMSIPDFSIGIGPQEYKANLEKLDRGETLRIDTQWKTSDGTLLDIEVVAGMIDDKNKIIQTIGRNITEQKNMERERESWIKELESANKHIKEASVQLVQSEKLSALGELAAGVAHELNQPLNGIKIISQSLLRDMKKNRVEEGEIENDLNEIVGQVNKMAEIIDHMRIYTRSTEGAPNTAIDINTVIDGPFKLLDQQLRNHNVEVIKEYASDLPKVTGNSIRLEQVFMNLINNARNALDGCGNENKRIEIRTYKTHNHGPGGETPSVVVEVKDNGCGIPEHLREKIFEPFFTTKEPGKGTGLGLSVSSKIIEEHGGKIEVASNVGEGTTFKIILPAAN